MDLLKEARTESDRRHQKTSCLAEKESEFERCKMILPLTSLCDKFKSLCEGMNLNPWVALQLQVKDYQPPVVETLRQARGTSACHFVYMFQQLNQLD